MPCPGHRDWIEYRRAHGGDTPPAVGIACGGGAALVLALSTALAALVRAWGASSGP